MIAFYSENGSQQTAKRPRVDYNQSTMTSENLFGTGGFANTFRKSNGNVVPAIMSPQYIEQQLNKKPLEPEKPNHILLFTIFNPNYPITCEVLNTICSPFGKVLRIVIFRKNGVQAMVEFESIESAKTAKESLYGCDIYSGCCTLKIENAKPIKLNVYKNDQDSYDYTNPNPGKQIGQDLSQPHKVGPQRPVLLKEPIIPRTQANGNGLSHSTFEKGIGHTSTHNSIPVQEVVGGHSVLHQCQTPPNHQRNPFFRGNGSGNSSAILSSPVNMTTPGQSIASATTFANQGSVCMVYGLNPEKMNASRLFNLFCLYGNVTRVKFLKTKEGCAMVQLGDAAAVERAIANLNNITFFGTKMQVGYSKQAFLADVQIPFLLSDNTPSFQDFMGSKNNRFMNPEMASKNRIQPPANILHFFNTPPSLEENDIEKLFIDQGVAKPKCVKLFPSKTERSSSGLVEFANQSDALEGLVSCNHLPVNNPTGKFPYIIKLCFSSSRNIPTTVRPI